VGNWLSRRHKPWRLSISFWTRFLPRVFLLVLPLVLVLGFSLNARAENDETLLSQSIYVAIEPALVTNYGGPGRMRYMSVDVSLRVRGVEGEQSVKHHMPYIKDAILNLFATQTTQMLDTSDGKEALRKESFEAVNAILLEEEKNSLLEDVLFTSFVVYR
jgi:flagellar FliL protein